MATLTITAKGQVTLRRSLMRHLGVKPGDKVEIDTLPDGRIALGPARRSRDILDLYGALAAPGVQPLSLDELDALIAEGWSGRR
ncbi:hypothetical protein STAQ_21120 [Allostella sp. ATCC 35155]|nr:hypothetical protein STAQ_21120 [Stella sp. ATCC 35155]